MASWLTNVSLPIVHKDLYHCNISFNDNKDAFDILCHACQVTKSHKLIFQSKASYVTFALQVVHNDICISPILFTNGYTHYVHFIDEFVRYI